MYNVLEKKIGRDKDVFNVAPIKNSQFIYGNEAATKKTYIYFFLEINSSI